MQKCEPLQAEATPRLLAALAAIRSELASWPAWWAGLSLPQRWLPLAMIAAYWLILKGIGGFRGDHVFLGIGVLLFHYTGRWMRDARPYAMPFLLTGILYDSQRFYADYIRGPIHVTQPYDFDKRFFGMRDAVGNLVTPNEWWQMHTHPALDLITGFFYLTFFSIFMVMGAYFFFWLSRKGTETMSPARVKEKAKRMNWSFLWLNLVGWSTYYWYAASPPWYVALYGLGPARADVPANAAGCLRFDQLLGTHFFTEMYGRSADVHGAIPSLHVAYPLLALIFAFQFKRLRVFSVLFYTVMCFSAVYLNHHYVLDILWGSAYTVLTAVAMDHIGDWRLKRQGIQLA